MPINKDFIQELLTKPKVERNLRLEGQLPATDEISFDRVRTMDKVQSLGDYFHFSPELFGAQPKQSRINRDFVESLAAGEHKDVQENKAKIYPAPNEFLRTQEVPEVLGELKRRTPVGVGEDIKQQGIWGLTKRLPGIGSSLAATKNIEISNAAKRLQSDVYGEMYSVPREQWTMQMIVNPHPKHLRGEDLKLVNEYFDDLEFQSRKKDFWAKSVSGILDMAPWMAEFAMTGGLAKLSNTATRKFGEKLLGKYALTKTGEMALRGAGWMGSAAARTSLGLGGRVAESYTQAGLPQGKDIETATIPEVNPYTNFAKAWGRTFIEAASEEAGEAISGRLLAELKSLKFGKAIINGVGKAWSKLSPENSMKKFFRNMTKKGGWSNMVGEVGEERLATFLHAIAGTESFGVESTGNPAVDIPNRLMAGFEQDVRNFPVEATVLGTVPGARFVLGQVGRIGETYDSKEKERLVRGEREGEEPGRPVQVEGSGEEPSARGGILQEQVAETPPTEAIPAPSKPKAAITPPEAKITPAVAQPPEISVKRQPSQQLAQRYKELTEQMHKLVQAGDWDSLEKWGEKYNVEHLNIYRELQNRDILPETPETTQEDINRAQIHLEEIERRKAQPPVSKAEPAKRTDIDEYLKLKEDFSSMKFNLGSPQAKKLQSLERSLLDDGILKTEETYKAPSDLKEKMLSRIKEAEPAKKEAPAYIKPSKVESVSQGNLYGARQAKKRAWERIQNLRQKIKDEPLGGNRTKLRVELLKAEDAHKEAINLEKQSLAAIERRAQELGQTTIKAEPAKIEKEIEYEKEAITEPTPSPQVDTGKAGKLVPTGKLDPTNPEEALELTKYHAQWVASGWKGDPRNTWEGISETKTEWDEKAKAEKIITTSVEYTPEQIDTAYRTIQKSVESPMPDTELFAMPGKEAQMKAIAEKMAKVKGVSKAKKTGPKPLTKPTALPKAKTTQADHIKAVYTATIKETSQYAINGVLVEGDTIVATDGRRMFWAKGKWGKDGLYLDATALKNGLLGKPTKEKINFPNWRDIIPDISDQKPILVPSGGIYEDLDTVFRRVRQVASITSEESRGITIIENKDGSLGFAAGAPEIGHAEINVNPGGKILGAVNPSFLMDVFKFHAIRGDTAFEFYFKNWDRPILTKSPDGKTNTLTMPVNPGEPSEAITKAISEGKPPAQVKPTTEITSPSGGFIGGRPATVKVSAIVKEDMSTGSKKADAFLRRTKGFTGEGQPGILSKSFSWTIETFKGFHYLQWLPKLPEYADIREHFRHTEEIKKLAWSAAVEKMKWAMKPIEGVKQELQKRFQALEMKIVADDLMEDVENGLELPPDLSKEDISTMKLKADKLYDKYPSVREAYERIRQVTKEIGNMLVEEGMLEPEKAKEFYFPHRVIKYLRTEDAFFGIPTQKPAQYKPGYLKQRKGGYDYSTDIMERLVEHWAQVQRDVAYRQFLENVLKEEQESWFRQQYPEWKEWTKDDEGNRTHNLVPEGYNEVTVLPGRYYYSTYGVTEDMAKAIINQNLNSIEEMFDEKAASQIRKVLALGKKRSYIVREPIARQLYDMPTRPISRNPAYLAVKGFHTFIKGQILFNPLYSLPFHLTNFIGDGHKVLVALPSALQPKYLANYWKEIINAHKGEKAERFELAQKYGVIGSGWIGVDITELKTIMPVIEKAEISGAAKHFVNKAKRLWNISKKVGQGREDWLRYALFDRLMDLTEQGEDVTKYAIKDSPLVKKITDPQAKAAKVARDIAGDYTAIGKTGRILSDVAVLFYRWMHLNLPWWPRMVKEYLKKGQYGRLIYALLAASAPYIISTIWNYSDDERRKLEQSLPPWKRWNFHINGLHGKRMYYTPLPLDDVFNFIGIPEDILDIQRYQRGMINAPELVKRIVINSTYEPGMSIINAVGGLPAIVRDAIGWRTFPDFKDYREKDWKRKGLNVAGDIFGAPAQLGKALYREGIRIDDNGLIVVGLKTQDTLDRSWMGIRPYSVDLGQVQALKGKSTYKKTQYPKSKGVIKGRAHKGKQRLVDSLKIQLEGKTNDRGK